MTECASDPDSISFTLLGEHSAVVNKLTGTVSSFLSDTVSFLVQRYMCPLMRIFVSTLGPQIAENIIKNGLQVADVPVKA
ncbi:BPI fold-containing family A member 2 [Myotis daubentonii]|uniref:BPI fold-containing family A member 2 n=1 Tax=Myotis daubentonii TaxID=98922 RepID=UPI002872B552|nr:BPI fold-containing family A member 2 [Myotis daubentonii]